MTVNGLFSHDPLFVLLDVEVAGQVTATGLVRVGLDYVEMVIPVTVNDLVCLGLRYLIGLLLPNPF